MAKKSFEEQFEEIKSVNAQMTELLAACTAKETAAKRAKDRFEKADEEAKEAKAKVNEFMPTYREATKAAMQLVMADPVKGQDIMSAALKALQPGEQA